MKFFDEQAIRYIEYSKDLVFKSLKIMIHWLFSQNVFMYLLASLFYADQQLSTVFEYLNDSVV